MWPPMDMIHHIWDDISTNRNDKVQRRLVVVASNGQYADFAINFAYSLIKQEVYNFVFVPLDESAFTKLHDKFPDHALPIVQEFITPYNTTTEAASYGSEEFKIVTSTRPMFLNRFLRNNITIFYNDIDMVWQYNAWDIIDQLRNKNNTNNNNHEVSSSREDFDSTTNQYDVLLWEDGPEMICTCLLYMVPSKISFIILEEWNKEIQTHVHYEDQKAFASASDRLKLSDETVNHEVRVMVNDEQFPTGGMYNWWDQQPESSTNEKAIIIHNNWVVGKDAKKERFVHANLWFVP
jgi:hypothetical protein